MFDSVLNKPLKTVTVFRKSPVRQLFLNIHETFQSCFPISSFQCPIQFRHIKIVHNRFGKNLTGSILNNFLSFSLQLFDYQEVNFGETKSFQKILGTYYMFDSKSELLQYLSLVTLAIFQMLKKRAFGTNVTLLLPHHHKATEKKGTLTFSQLSEHPLKIVMTVFSRCIESSLA